MRSEFGQNVKIMWKFASCACFALNWRSRKTENIPWRIQRQNSIWSFSKLFSYYRIVIVSMIMIIVVTTLIIMITISQWAFEALMWATKLEMEYEKYHHHYQCDHHHHHHDHESWLSLSSYMFCWNMIIILKWSSLSLWSLSSSWSWIMIIYIIVCLLEIWVLRSLVGNRWGETVASSALLFLSLGQRRMMRVRSQVVVVVVVVFVFSCPGSSIPDRGHWLGGWVPL